MKTEKNEIIRQKLDSEAETNRTGQNSAVQFCTVQQEQERNKKSQEIICTHC